MSNINDSTPNKNNRSSYILPKYNTIKMTPIETPYKSYNIDNRSSYILPKYNTIKMTPIETPYKSYNIDNDTDSGTFIHFDNAKLCEQFKQSYTGRMGHTCCSGIGCFLINIDNNNMHIIKKNFIKNTNK